MLIIVFSLLLFFACVTVIVSGITNAQLMICIHRRRMPIDDQDLLDHPEKPDYGTLAIDDAIREGERVA